MSALKCTVDRNGPSNQDASTYSPLPVADGPKGALPHCIQARVHDIRA